MQDRFRFRGKLSHSGEWVYGNLVIAENGKPYIIPPEVLVPDGHHLRDDSDKAWWVAPDTVGQCTGLKDRNGRLIYEGDVVKSCRGEIGVVEWDQKACAYFAVNKSDGWDFSANDSHPCEIIGTIHENPELLEEQK